MPPLDNAHQLERRALTIVESLQGTWRRGKGMCCCPAHDDRTPSLSVTLGRKAILFHCFAGCPNEDVIAALDRLGVRSCDLFNSSDARSIERQSHGDFNPNARRLWQSATAISDSPAARYLAQRGLLPASEQLRYLARTPLGPRDAVQFLPAMLAAVTTDIGIIAVHRTFLDIGSGKLAGFERPKRALGSLGYGAVRLAPAEQDRLGLAEGIETEAEYSDSSVSIGADDLVVAGDSAALVADRNLYAGLRLGANFGAMKLYVKGGYSNFRVSAKYNDEAFRVKASDELEGYVVGAGLEQMLNQRFTARVEYRYADYGQVNLADMATGLDASRHQVVAGLLFGF